jgi:hypothetical protein
MTLFELDPDSVKAGLLPLLIVLGMAVVIGLGYFSMRSHIRKISAPYADELEEGGSGERGGERIAADAAESAAAEPEPAPEKAPKT